MQSFLAIQSPSKRIKCYRYLLNSCLQVFVSVNSIAAALYQNENLLYKTINNETIKYICTTLTPQVKGNHGATNLMFPSVTMGNKSHVPLCYKG